MLPIRPVTVAVVPETDIVPLPEAVYDVIALSPTLTGADQDRLTVVAEVAVALIDCTGPGNPDASCMLLVLLGEVELVIPDLLALDRAIL